MDILGGIDRNPSPRKGRNRTGTMIFSEAHIMAEELGKGGGSPGPESDSVVHLSPAPTEMPESEGDFVHVDVSSHESEEEEEEEHSDEEHDDDSHLEMPAEEATRAYELEHLEGDHMATLSDMHAHVEAIHDDQAPEQDVTDDAEDTASEHIEGAPEHDVTSAHEATGTTIIELSPADDVDALEEEVREEEEDEEEEEEEDEEEEDLTEAVVEAHDEEDDAADAREVAKQISLDEPHEQPDAA
jgi:hypothetical protein